jgi:hypothetical protein
VAASQCRIATDELVRSLTAAGVQAQAVWVRGHRTEPPEASRQALAADRHMLARLPEGFVDVTRRQYDRGTHPRFYSSEADLAQEWREIDDGPANGSLDDERWRQLALTAWSPGGPGKGVLMLDGALHCWSVNDEGVPHHPSALLVLERELEDVEQSIVIAADGKVELRLLPDEDVGAAARIEAADARLTVTPLGLFG